MVQGQVGAELLLFPLSLESVSSVLVTHFTSGVSLDSGYPLGADLWSLCYSKAIPGGSTRLKTQGEG